MPVRRGGQRGAHRHGRAHGPQLALLPAGRRAPASATATASTAATRPRTATASTRSSCSSTPTPRRSRAASTGTRPTCCPTRPTTRRTPTSSPTTRTTPSAIPKSVVVDRSFDWEGDVPPRRPWNETIIYETHVKGYTKRHPAVREDLRGTYAGLASEEALGLPQAPGRHRGRAAAHPPHRRRVLPARPRAEQLLGLQLDRLPRAALRVRRHRAPRRSGARVQGDGQGAAPRGHRGHPRRRLQPHRRGQPPRPDAVLQGRRQLELLPPGARRRAPLHGLHGHGQHARRPPPQRAAADHGLAALLGQRVPRRRLPLRPRQRPGPRALRRRPPERLLRHHPPGPDPVAGQAHRRAVGRRARRLPGRQLPGPVERVERHLPRRRARLLARAVEHRRVRLALHRLAATSTSPTGASRSPRSTSSPPTTASRCATSRPTTRSTTRPTARATATAPTTTARGTAASRGRPTTRRSSRCAGASSATSWPR